MDASVIIIGSGYSAAAVVAHLTHAGLPTHEVLVIGSGALGTGQAYGCTADSFRLNVRENLQRLWPDQPEHLPTGQHHIYRILRLMTVPAASTGATISPAT